MRRIHYPVLLGNVDKARGSTFVRLFATESICRALLATIVPIKAYEMLGDAQLVSLLYFSVSLVGLTVSLVVPLALHIARRRWVLTAGAISYVICGILYSAGSLHWLIAGLAAQIFGTAILEVVINLYLLDHVPRRELNHFEPRRLLFSGMAFFAGPWLGVYLDRNVLENSTFLVVACSALVLLAYFWALRLTDGSSIQPAKTTPPNPLKYIPRFVSQKRLVLAWALAVGRNGWWLMYFIYTPIYVAEAGYSAETGGALVSLGVLPMILVRYWGVLGKRYGLRKLLICSYFATGTATIAAGIFASVPLAGMALLWSSAFLATLIDAAGNVPFLRAVHPFERVEMTSVFMTFRQVTSFLTPGLFAVVLVFLPLPFVFVTGGLAFWLMAWISRYLPRGL